MISNRLPVGALPALNPRRVHGVGPIWFGIALLFAIFQASAMGIARAQSGGEFAITRSTIDAGGARVTGGDFVVTGTIAQADADPTAASGGGFTLRGGFHVALAASQQDDAIFSDGFD